MSTAPIQDYSAYEKSYRSPKPSSSNKRTPPKKKPKSQMKTKRKASLVVILAEFAVVLTLAGACTFWVSVLMGKSLAEKASKDIGVYNGRAKAAMAEADLIRQRFDNRANPKKVAEWARNHGMDRDTTTGVSQQ